ncbi:serine/threonine protein kinase [Streptomyces sp. HNM0663]|uniref:Serine/threonine protein kinase n=1 Tax=Streptomyces chengmaiensis TaxID=3040919 RepID=A0ABT6I030_9ACTN|nr:serine/threonine protein kinase [Streptomyces chengmaiensis]MDH2393918.1 serine/threonine protein kinase [Streptomyces chengmaiensis]
MARLGAGGMGRVYLGRSTSGRAVAVKVIRAELAEDPHFRRRFAREIAAVRRVAGFFTAAVVDAEVEKSPAWLATAYVPGMSLEEAVRVHGAWAEESAMALGAGLAEALEAIHSAGVIHRDLKPSNVLLAADGPRVIDFGISCAAEASALTHTGMAIGTPGYMSPEQVTGGAVGPASDVFSLGSVLTFAATGAGPFGSGLPHAVNFRAVYEEPVLHQLPAALQEFVRSCLAKVPAHRPTVAALLDRLAKAARLGDDVTSVLATAAWLPAAVATAVSTRSADVASVPTEPATKIIAADLLSRSAVTPTPPPPVLQPVAPRRIEVGQWTTRVAFSPDGTRLATGSSRRVGVWDLRDANSSELLWRQKIGDWLLDSLKDMAFSPDGTRLATATLGERTAVVWDADTGERLLQIAHGRTVEHLAFSPDSTRLATVPQLGTVLLWDAATGRQLLEFPKHGEDSVSCVAFGPDGTRLATGSVRAALLWDAGTGNRLMLLHHDTATPHGLAFSADGARLATFSEDSLAVWDVTSGERLHHIPQRGNNAGAVAFSPDGTRLATGHGKTAAVWDAATGQRLIEVAHKDMVWGMEFNGDGTRLATGSIDKTAAVWDISSTCPT